MRERGSHWKNNGQRDSSFDGGCSPEVSPPSLSDTKLEPRDIVKVANQSSVRGTNRVLAAHLSGAAALEALEL